MSAIAAASLTAATSSPPLRRSTPSLAASTTRSCSPTSSPSPSESNSDDKDIRSRLGYSRLTSRALAFGKTEEQVKEELGAATSNAALVKSKIFEGNKPTNSIMFQKLTPGTLGSLIALYEHKIHVQGAIWGINSYDQMGVELGKVLAKNILSQLGNESDVKGHDSSVSQASGRSVGSTLTVDHRSDPLLPKEPKVKWREVAYDVPYVLCKTFRTSRSRRLTMAESIRVSSLLLSSGRSRCW